MLNPGDQVHHYIVEAEVGGGGMARVYRVRHAILGHALALKVLDPYWVGQASVRKRFLAEGQIQALVRHPAIVMVTDAVVDAPRGLAGLVMEYVEGPNLEQLVFRTKERPNVELIRKIMVPVLRAMHHAHQEGVVHRDLKPANVLLSRDASGSWYPRIVDFGVAHVVEEASKFQRVRRNTQGGFIGTPAFMCPEQVEGRTEPTPQWDVFSLGIMLYELATLVHPFEKDDEADTLAAIQACEFVPPRQHAPDLDPHVEAAILGSLIKEPSQRFQDCDAMASTLAEELTLPSPASAPLIRAVQLGRDDGDDFTMPVPDPPEAYLLMGDVPSNQREWQLKGWSSTVGTGRKADIKLPSGGGVEAIHCEIAYESGQWLITDRSSSGTRVNGARIRAIQLDDGDLLRLGHTVLRFRAVETVPELDLDLSEPMQPTQPNPPPEEEEEELSLDLDLTEPGQQPTVIHEPLYQHWLEVRDRVHGRRKIAITYQGLIVGRDPDAPLYVPDPEVSRQHCRILVQGLDIVVEDLDSANGTWVNGQRIRFRAVRAGDVVKVGETSMTIHSRK